MIEAQIRHAIPPTRLPFINTEIETTTFRGEPHLVSSVWGGEGKGYLFFWNPETGSQGRRRLPDDIPGAYMLKTGPDGRLYVGCGRGELVRYCSEADAFEVLVNDAMSSITWGGCVTDRYVVWCASPGEVAVYDWHAGRLVKTFKPLDELEPPSLYGHRATVTPEGRVLVAMNVPQARLILLDLETLEAKTLDAPSLAGCDATYGARFVDDQTLMLEAYNTSIGKVATQFLRWPELSLIEAVEAKGVGFKSAMAMVDGRLYGYMTKDDTLRCYDRAAQQWSVVCEGWADSEPCIMSRWGERDLCGVTVGGRALRWNAAKREREVMDLAEAEGQLVAHAMCVVPELDLAVTAPFINQRFSTMKLSTGEGADAGRAAPGGGQINQMLWEPQTRCVLMSSYTSASVTAYDPSKPTGWPANPRVLASAASEGQMRPQALVHDGRYVWMASGPQYGKLDGALSRVDPLTGEMRVWRNLIEDQTPKSLLLDAEHEWLLGSTWVFADCNSTPPTRDAAMLFVFDRKTLTLREELSVQTGSKGLSVHAALPGGEVLVADDAQPWAWQPTTGAIRELGPLPANVCCITSDEQGRLWLADDKSVGRLWFADDQFTYEPMVNEPGNHLQVVGDRLYYATATQVCAVEVGQGAAETVAG
ncbi:hypothetical protein ACERK3_14700 [Phycisphaerales bacterium AB-hyl4]|uniref:Uncharacterized protein n=1 Tax=Natronomicrosphaera hydrolytica TaxID=3242702 RepID=A0ABV4U7E9_9BACT